MELDCRPRSPLHRPDFRNGESEKGPAVAEGMGQSEESREGLSDWSSCMTFRPRPCQCMAQMRGAASEGRGGEPFPREGGASPPMPMPNLAQPDPPAPEGGREGGAQARRARRTEERKQREGTGAGEGTGTKGAATLGGLRKPPRGT